MLPLYPRRTTLIFSHPGLDLNLTASTYPHTTSPIHAASSSKYAHLLIAFTWVILQLEESAHLFHLIRIDHLHIQKRIVTNVPHIHSPLLSRWRPHTHHHSSSHSVIHVIQQTVSRICYSLVHQLRLMTRHHLCDRVISMIRLNWTHNWWQRGQLWAVIIWWADLMPWLLCFLNALLIGLFSFWFLAWLLFGRFNWFLVILALLVEVFLWLLYHFQAVRL